MRIGATLAVIVVLGSGAARGEPTAESGAGRSARRALLRARTQCAAHGPVLTAMVAGVFDPDGFGRAVVRGWRALGDDQRADFDALADRVVGGEERARAEALICLPGARIVDVTETRPDAVHIKLRRPGDQDCASLMFERAGNGWRYTGEWSCGKSIFLDEWRHRLGGGDYDAAMTYLRGAAAP